MADRRITHGDWVKEAESRFGEKHENWRFVCPCCGVETSGAEWKAANAIESFAFSCIGRFTRAAREAFGEGPGPCNYAGGGLFRLNPVTVVFKDGKETSVFEFAPDGTPKAGES